MILWYRSHFPHTQWILGRRWLWVSALHQVSESNQIKPLWSHISRLACHKCSPLPLAWSRTTSKSTVAILTGFKSTNFKYCLGCKCEETGGNTQQPHQDLCFHHIQCLYSYLRRNRFWSTASINGSLLTATEVHLWMTAAKSHLPTSCEKRQISESLLIRRIQILTNLRSGRLLLYWYVKEFLFGRSI